MRRALRTAAFILFTAGPLSPQVTAPENYSATYRAAVKAYFAAQSAYRMRDYRAASDTLETLWKAYPAGSDAWVAALREGVDFGSPPCYSALRMLTECVRWRLRGASPQVAGVPVRLAVVLVGHSSGIQPRTRQELAEHGGVMVRNTIRPDLAGAEVIDQATWLFREYLLAITGGRMPVELHRVELPDVDVAMHVVEVQGRQSAYSAEPIPGEMPKIWKAISPEQRSQVDLWWLLYPSHRPEDYPELAHTGFSNGGGTNLGPDGDTFLTFGDDLALFRKPPAQGKTPYTPEERTAYWAQLLQHEFFHHLFRIYPEFRLEAKSHQWFDRGAWPSDFEGRLEADYYAEAVHKRLLSADPPLFEKLRCAIPAPVLAQITPAAIAGSYRHAGVDSRIAVDGAALRWQRPNGSASKLWRQFSPLIWRTDGGKFLRILLRRGPSGEHLPAVAGFEMDDGERYEKR